MKKLCPKCQITKPASEYSLRTNGRLYSYCRPCQRAAVAASDRKHGRISGVGKGGANVEAWKKRKSRLERFSERYVVAPSGCWEWTGRLNKHGYGKLGWRGYETAHRFSFFTHKGPIPAEMCVCHSCDNRACVNPDHLWLGTHADNISDRDKKERNVRGLRVRPKHQITIEKAKQVLAAIENGMTQEKAAREFGISAAEASLISRRMTWHFRDAPSRTW